MENRYKKRTGKIVFYCFLNSLIIMLTVYNIDLMVILKMNFTLNHFAELSYSSKYRYGYLDYNP